MKKLFTGNGIFTEEGEQFISSFKYSLSLIMMSDNVNEMSDSELKMLQANLSNLIGDTISKKISHNLQFISELNAMTNEQFYIYLKEKYGNNWALHSLEKEERARLPIPDLQKIADEQEHIGAAIMEYMISNGVRLK